MNKINILSLSLVSLAVFACLFGIANFASADCTLTTGQLRADIISGQVVATYLSTNNGWTFTNNTSCNFPITLWSGKTIAGTPVQPQVDIHYYTVPANSNNSYTISVPTDCGYQFDFWYGNSSWADNNWAVNGLGGKIIGTECQQNTSVPTNLSATACPTGGGTITASWTPLNASNPIEFRVNDQANDWNGQCAPYGGTPNAGDTCVNPSNYSPQTFTGVAGHTYNWWIAESVNGVWTTSVGGPTTIICASAACTTNWQTGSWGSCVNGTQTRTVTDANGCNITTGEPATTQACSNTCTSWTYSDWSSCVNGTQTRSILTSSPSGCTGGNPVTSQSCSNNSVSVSCYATPSQINQNQSASFIANATGGNGAYTYSWAGACTGSAQVCNNVFSNTGTQTASVVATSNGQTNTATCSVVVSGNNSTCTQNSYERCSGNYLYWYDSCGNIGSVAQYCSNGCYNNSCGNNNYTNGNLTATKTVRDLTSGTGFSTSTYANPSDTLLFMITLQANGQDIQNVFARDNLPANLIYNNQLTVACTSNNGNYNNSNNCNGSNYNNYSGNITSGINIGTIYSGQTITITYQTQVAPAVNFVYGTTTINNNVSVTSSNGSNPSASASVIVTRGQVLGASTISTGLTNNFWVDSFFLPLLLTLIGLWMWKSGMFFGAEKWFDSKKKRRQGFKAEKELQNRISQIKSSAR